MLSLRDTVEDALGTEDVGGRSVDGGGEISIPFAVGGDAAEIILFNFHRLGDLSLLLWTWLGKFLFYCEMDFDLRIICAGDCERAAELHGGLRFCALAREFQCVLAGLGGEAHSREDEPRFCRRGVDEGEVMAEPLAGQGVQFYWRFHLE